MPTLAGNCKQLLNQLTKCLINWLNLKSWLLKYLPQFINVSNFDMHFQAMAENTGYVIPKEIGAFSPRQKKATAIAAAEIFPLRE